MQITSGAAMVEMATGGKATSGGRDGRTSNKIAKGDREEVSGCLHRHRLLRQKAIQQVRRQEAEGGRRGEGKRKTLVEQSSGKRKTNRSNARVCQMDSISMAERHASVSYTHLTLPTNDQV